MFVGTVFSTKGTTMASFCHDCSIDMFGEDFGDLAGWCKENEYARILCEGCGGYIIVDYLGNKISECPKEEEIKRIEQTISMSKYVGDDTECL